MVSNFKHRELRINTNTSSYQGLWQELRAPAPLPPRRCHHSAVIVQNKLVVYGGQDITIGVFNDLWVLNIDNCNPQSERWYNINAIGDFPGPLCRHSAVVYNEEVFIYGGTNGDNENSSTYKLNLETQTWSQYPGPKPGVDSHSAIVYKDLMVIFGGYQGGSLVNKLYVQSLSDLAWTQKEPEFFPSPRAGHRAVLYNRHMWIYGGRSYDSNYLEDLWKLNLEEWTWSLIEYTGNAPGVVSAHSACVYGEVMLIFGGVRDMLKETNEMFTYDFRANNWVLIQTETDIEDPVSDKEHSESTMKSKKTLESKRTFLAVEGNLHSHSGSESKKPKHKRNNSYKQSEDSRNSYKGNHGAKSLKGRVRGKVPHSRDGHTANLFEDFMIIFGGDRHQMAFNDVYFYTITEKILKKE